MALKASIYKVELQVSDLDRHYYASHSLTLACHPSETEERLMVRLISFALNASEQTEFCKGLSDEDEPAIWQKSLSDEIELWVELGNPSDKRLKQACGKAKQVVLYCYGESNASEIWWQKNQSVLSKLGKLKVYRFPKDVMEALSAQCQRNMDLQLTIEDQSVSLSNNDTLLEVELECWQ